MAEPSSAPSLPRVGDVVEGRFKILRGDAVKYQVLDTQTGEVRSKQYSLNEEDRYAHSQLPEFKHYQIGEITIKYNSTGLNSASVKLALLQGPQGEKVEGGGRIFKLKDKGKILAIRDALEKRDLDVYCTLVNHWGVEVLGDIRSLPKDPPILKLPEEMMDMICKHLDDKDLYSLRLVSTLIPQRFLPIHKLWRIEKLELDFDEKSSMVRLSRKNKGGSLMRYFNRGPHLNFVEEGYAEFLRTTKELRVDKSNSGEDEELLLTVKNNCTNLEKITLSFDEVFEPSLISKLTSGNQGTLKEILILFENFNLMNYDFDFSSISECKRIRQVGLQCRRIVNLESLASLKNTLRILCFSKLKEPLRNDQLIWIPKNLPNLDQLYVDTLHDCFDTKVGEIDEGTVVSILDEIDKDDFHLTIYFQNCTDGREGKGRKSVCGRCKDYCGKANRLRKQVMRTLTDKGKSSVWISFLSEFIHDDTTKSNLNFDRYSKLEFYSKDEDEDDEEDYSKDSSEDEQEG